MLWLMARFAPVTVLPYMLKDALSLIEDPDLRYRTTEHAVRVAIHSPIAAAHYTMLVLYDWADAHHPKLSRQQAIDRIEIAVATKITHVVSYNCLLEFLMEEDIQWLK